jgi:hypothetical protein
MDRNCIATLRSKITPEQAVQRFTRGAAGLSRCMLLGPLRSIADVYVPFRLYSIHINDDAQSQTSIVGLDAITGALDLYWFTAKPSEQDITHVHTSNHMPITLDNLVAQQVVESRVQRLVFQRRGFFGVRQLKARVECAGAVHVPYWIALFGRTEKARLVVMDAVGGALEGAKVRRLIYDWLL